MFKNYLKIAWRNLIKNKAHTFINIGGLAVGMAVALLIALWIYDELSYNKFTINYNQIAKVMQSQKNNGIITTDDGVPIPLRTTLANDYPTDFKRIALFHGTGEIVLANNSNKFTKTGGYAEAELPEMLNISLLRGARTLKDPYSILLSGSLANTIYGGADPINQILRLDNKLSVKVAGVYKDFPNNSEFRDMSFLIPWAQFVLDQGWVQRCENNWGVNAFQLYVELNHHSDIEQVSSKIRQLKAKHDVELAKFDPQIFLQPMSDWHLYSEWTNGKRSGGQIQFVWLFGIIGVFVLLLACINFINLSTARSQKRAKEVGIRKAIGSVKQQLILQFLSESFLVVMLAFLFSLLLTSISLSWFNQLADKDLSLPLSNAAFYILVVGFIAITGILAGFYPAIYLSSFQPVKVLKGTFQYGRFSSLPRKILVVVQFTASVALIFCAIIVFNQIKYVQNRPIGYDRSGVLRIRANNPEILNHFDALRNELIQTGAVTNVAESSTSTTESFSSDTRFEWKGKDPNLLADLDVVACSYDYGKTIGFQIKEGRDFSRDFATDSTAVILNEAAVKFMGLKNPIGEQIRWVNENYTVIGVIKNMVMSSPFEPTKQTIFKLSTEWVNFINIKLNPDASVRLALNKIAQIFNKYNPESPFNYNFLDIEYGKKFSQVQRISKLTTLFAILAIFISFLGLFGLASFLAEQRTKEIGIRKVLGASIANLWQLLSKDFVVLVLISCLVAAPIAWYFMNGWLQKYTYHSEISWWIFVVAGAGALAITLLTVSYQAIKMAVGNPVKSLKTE